MGAKLYEMYCNIHIYIFFDYLLFIYLLFKYLRIGTEFLKYGQPYKSRWFSQASSSGKARLERLHGPSYKQWSFQASANDQVKLK